MNKYAIAVVSILFSVLSGVSSFYYYFKAEQLVEDHRLLYSDHEMLVKNVNEVHDYLKLIEQTIPEVQKRNAKIKVVSDTIKESLRETKSFDFKSDKEYYEYVSSVVEYSDLYKVPVSLILAISRSESNYNPRAVSQSNARGMMQLLESTMDYCAKSINKYQYDAFYVRDNVQCGTWYLRQLMNIFKGKDLSQVIMSYNAGPNFVLKFNGENLPDETVEYHKKVSSFMERYKVKFYWEKQYASL